MAPGSDLETHVRRLVQEFLSVREEDCAWLLGEKGSNWNAAYGRCLDYVSRKTIRCMTWREWLECSGAVQRHVKDILEKRR